MMKKILIIEDEAMIRVNLEAFLEDEGYAVSAFEFGHEGINYLSNNDDVVVTIVDVRLPDTDGTTFILKAIKIRTDMHFIIYTGSREYELPPELQEVGMKSWQLIYKPLIEMEIMSQTIERLLQP